jgi:transposase
MTPFKLTKGQVLDLIRSEAELLINQRLEEFHAKTKDEEYLTRDQVATMCNVHVVTVQDWDKKGILQKYRVGNGRGRVLYKKSEVDAAIRKVKNTRNDEV